MRVPLVAGIVAAVCVAVAAPAAAAVPARPGQPPTPKLSAWDRAFLTEATQGAQFEVTAGKLAHDRAGDLRIRAFGDRMARDHGAELQQVQALDRSLGITPPAAPGAEQQQVLAIWSSVNGGAFDCSYAPTMYADHEADLGMYMAVAKHAGDARVRAFAKAQVPTLRQHLQLAATDLTALNCSAPQLAPASPAAPSASAS
jgi:putative membrane protein